ncbi:MAG: hypothetical protein AVDCRST_MAG54-1011, partial [uncultured Actinomycetospora sp.]
RGDADRRRGQPGTGRPPPRPAARARGGVRARRRRPSRDPRRAAGCATAHV